MYLLPNGTHLFVPPQLSVLQYVDANSGLQVALRVAVRNRTADGARQVAGEYATSVITYVRQVSLYTLSYPTTTFAECSPLMTLSSCMVQADHCQGA